MKGFAVFQLLLIALLMISGCTIESVEDTSLPVVTDKVENNNLNAIIVDMPEWTFTKANDLDVLHPELVVGDTVAVLNEEGIIYPYTIVECGKHAVVLENPDVELVEGLKYRVQYPMPEGRESPFMFFLYFGDYDMESVSWMISDWKKNKKDETLHFKFNLPNSVLVFNLTAPFDCVVDEVRLHTDNQCVFCLKGAFDGRKDKIFPERSTWVTSLGFSQRGMVWEKGKCYKIYLTVWPEKFSKENYSLDIYTEDDRGASAAVSLPDIKAGTIMEFDVDEFDILPSPVTKKDVREQDRYLDEVVCEFWHPGELY